MRKTKIFIFLFVLCACRSAPTRQEVIDNALSVQAAKDAIDEAKKEADDAADDLTDAADAVPEGVYTAKLNKAVTRAASALEQATRAGEQCKSALDSTQKLFSASETARGRAEKERDENARDAFRWRVTQWVLVVGVPALLVFVFVRRFA